MPGIAGVFAVGSSAAWEETTRLMLRTMHDLQASEQGTCFMPDLGVYAGWVAHESSYAARQSSTIGRSGVVLAFAGECHGHGDPLERYEGEGDGFLERLNGLFSGLLVDSRRKRALLFNDRYGVERLYVAEKDGVTWFASEAKALLAVLPDMRNFDETGLAQFLAFGSTHDGHTLFRGIRLLPGGSLLIAKPGRPLQRRRYFVPRQWEELPQLDDQTFERSFIETFHRVLPRYLAGGSAVGVSLTAGLDSRMIMACLPVSPRPTIAYTYGAETGDTLDVRIARRVAAACGLEHRTLRIGADFVSNFGSHVDRTVQVSDGCASAAWAHELYLSKQARGLAPVRLTGNYGSEVLRSATTFKPLGLPSEMLAPGVAAVLASVVSAARSKAITTHPVTSAAFQEVPWHLFGNRAVARSQLTCRSPFLDNEVVELAYRASPSQRRSPRPSLQLIDHGAPALSVIPTDRGIAFGQGRLRSLAMQVACRATFKLDYWRQEGMPDSLLWTDAFSGVLSRLGLLGLHKFLSYRSWFRRELAAYVREVLTDGRAGCLPFLDRQALPKLVDEHVGGRRNRVVEINAVLTLEAVDRMLLRAAPSCVGLLTPLARAGRARVERE